MIALLRGINVGGHKKVPMAELRELASGLGLDDVTTYIQSGNLLFDTSTDPADVETSLEQAIADHFGFSVDVVVRTNARWLEYAASSPFPDAETDRPNLLHLALCKHAVPDDALEKLTPYASANERIIAIDDALWIDFATSVGTSKLTPKVLDRAAGSPVTARNWRTVQKLAELAR